MKIKSPSLRSLSAPSSWWVAHQTWNKADNSTQGTCPSLQSMHCCLPPPDSWVPLFLRTLVPASNLAPGWSREPPPRYSWKMCLTPSAVVIRTRPLDFDCLHSMLILIFVLIGGSFCARNADCHLSTPIVHKPSAQSYRGLNALNVSDCLAPLCLLVS